MKEAFTRVLAYIAVALVITAIFQAFPNVPAHSSLINRILYSIGFYAAAWAPIAVFGESIYLISNFIRRRSKNHTADEGQTKQKPDL